MCVQQCYRFQNIAGMSLVAMVPLLSTPTSPYHPFDLIDFNVVLHGLDEKHGYFWQLELSAKPILLSLRPKMSANCAVKCSCIDSSLQDHCACPGQFDFVSTVAPAT